MKTSLWAKCVGNKLVKGLRAPAGQAMHGWLTGLKVVYVSLVLLGVWVWNDFDGARLKAINAQWFDNTRGWTPPVGTAGLSRHFVTWDAEHSHPIGM